MSKQKKIILLTAIVLALTAIIYAVFYMSGKNSSNNSPDRNAQQNTTIQENTEPAEGTLPDAKEPEQTDTSQTASTNTSDLNENFPPKQIKDIKVKALYLSGPTMSSQKSVEHYIELVKNTELNALVIDIKEAGYVNYESSVPMVKESGLYKKYYKPDELVKKLHDNGIYVIGRLVTFRDPGLAAKRTDFAIKRPDGSLWREGKLGPWTNPYNKEVWDYNIQIAKEAADFGFDEIQFDYVRFPTTTKSNRADYGENPAPRDETIAEFLKLATQELHDKGTAVSADVFGIICESISDGKAIGQHLETIGMDVDAISPMVYPSHYAVGQIVNGVKFMEPDLKPYEVVYNTLVKCKDRISKVEGYNAVVRPYLQDFTASYLEGKAPYQQYGVKQIREQIKAVYDAGYEEWILWDGSNTYTEAALLKE